MNELDILMNLDPLELTRDSPELEALIKAYRQQRANAEAGIKPKKEAGPKASLSGILDNLIKPKAPAAPGSSGLRRV